MPPGLGSSTLVGGDTFYGFQTWLRIRTMASAIMMLIFDSIIIITSGECPSCNPPGR